MGKSKFLYKKSIYKIYRNLVLLVLTVLGIFISMGCQSSGKEETEKVSARMQQALYDKYGIQFRINLIEEVAGDHAFTGSWYYGQVSQDGVNETFKAFMSRDGKKLKDNYARLVYNGIICELVQREMDNWQNSSTISGFSYQIMYALEEKAWNSEDTLKEYLQSSNTYVDICLQYPHKVSGQESGSIYGLLRQLEGEGLQFTVNCKFEDKTIHIVYDKTTPFLSYKDIFSKFAVH